jgi:hypothetical protein
MKKSMVTRITYWWKRRSFYIAIQDGFVPLYQTIDISRCKDEAPDRTLITETSEDLTADFDTASACSPRDVARSSNKASCTTKPNQCDEWDDQMIVHLPPSRSSSLCSLDSLVDSYRDSSLQGSVKVDDGFLIEHVRFLRIQAAPRRDEAVWYKESDPPMQSIAESLLFDV